MAKRDLSGQVAIVTGASSGIGWQAAVRLAEQGVKVCVTARRKDALEKLKAQIEARPGPNGAPSEVLVVPADVTIDAEVQEVVRRCLEHFGRLDILVNNAAVQVYDYFDRLRWEEITRVFDVTTFGYFRFARAVLPHFRTLEQGHIINVASMLSIGAAPLLSAYTAAKHALLGWSDCIRLELYDTGIDVSAILIPSVSTPMFDHAPMKMGLAPKPVPPTYDTDVGARAVVRCAHRPHPRYVPVFVQGTAMLWLQNVAPWFGDLVMGKWGAKLQMTNKPIDSEHGNLFGPTERGVGPYGPIPPTPTWKRLALLGAGVAGVAAIGTVAGGIGVSAFRLARAAG